MKRHKETHFTASATVRDIIIGMSDGLTVPFALAAGLSSAAASSHIVTVGGLAEIAAGSVSMGLGGYLAAQSDDEHYKIELDREKTEIREVPAEEKQEVDAILRSYGLSPEESAPLVEALSKRPEAWVDFMMRFELGLEKPNPKRELSSALTIACSYAVGGLIPLLPYFFLKDVQLALYSSAGITLIALAVFGYFKAHFLGTNPLQNAGQTVLIGGITATIAFILARLVS